ncbi:NAD(P)H-quinone oxidoreductase [Candidatus Thiosymbion oneisti]|uniref:NAD(P)H-quinone oxidoreductase n=1 Tax=Candidatus Thiosymbion oneisti TaxID=589554 RepID=UPI000AEFA71D|nr:NAD(P)H-quinone oxidoreductase [Candidatus Thiosymbion oneisti]
MSTATNATMKAVLIDKFGGAEVLRIGEAERPTPGNGQALVEVAATSVNRPDIVQREGKYPPPKGDSELLGLEVAGTVRALGAGVDRWSVGDRVMGLVGGGGYAEYAVAYADHLMRIPETMNFEEAAGICEAYITAYLNVFMIGGLKDGDGVLLHGGGGGVNTAAVQLCRALTPAAKVLVTASPGKLERVAALGADPVIDYRSQDFAEEVRRVTDGRGVQVILDHIGAAYLASNMKSLAVGGRLVLIGVTSGIKAELNLALMMVKRQQVIGSVLRSRSVPEKAAIVAEFSHRVLPLLAERKVVPLIHKVYRLDDVAQAQREMEASAHFGKIVLSLV